MASSSKLRALFEKRLAQGIPIPPGEFHPQDLERIKDDRYLNRIIEHCKKDMVVSSKLLWNIMKWRKTVGASDINEDNLRMEYVNEGILFCHGRDLDGCKLVIVKCNKYVRGVRDLVDVKRVVIYWLDRVEREENGNKVTLFFDLDGAGLNNFDIDFVRYLISLFTYYPKFLNQIVVYQLPWILSATFKLTKKLLPPEAVEIIRLVNKENILTEIVSPEQALVCWGGKDDYEFKFIPERKTTKRVSFATTTDRQNSYASTISTVSTEDSIVSTNRTNIHEELITIEPTDKIIFKNENEELAGELQITNMLETPVAFKIRTTGPEKFWVRPSSGILPPKRTEHILINILPGYENPAAREKFLVMATPITNSNEDFSQIWKNASKSDIEEHRLRCQVIDNSTKNVILNNETANGDAKTKLDIDHALDNLKKEVIVLKNEVVRLKVYLYLSIGLGLISVLLGYLIHKDLRDINLYKSENFVM